MQQVEAQSPLDNSWRSEPDIVAAMTGSQPGRKRTGNQRKAPPGGYNRRSPIFGRCDEGSRRKSGGSHTESGTPFAGEGGLTMGTGVRVQISVLHCLRTTEDRNTEPASWLHGPRVRPRTCARTSKEVRQNDGVRMAQNGARDPGQILTKGRWVTEGPMRWRGRPEEKPRRN